MPAPEGESQALLGHRPLCPNVNLSLNGGRERGFTMKKESFEGKILESLGNISSGCCALKEPLLSASHFFLPPSGKIPKLLWLSTNYSFGLPARKLAEDGEITIHNGFEN